MVYAFCMTFSGTRKIHVCILIGRCYEPLIYLKLTENSVFVTKLILMRPLSDSIPECIYNYCYPNSLKWGNFLFFFGLPYIHGIIINSWAYVVLIVFCTLNFGLEC